MPERSQEVVIRGGRLALRSSRVAGQSSPLALVAGPAAFDADLRPSDGAPGWYDEVLAEGGFLIDFDRRRLLAFSWDDASLRAAWPEIEAAWAGWTVEEVADGTADFLRYLAAVGVPLPRKWYTPPP